ncbi:hypothetical protein EPUS_07470 [Endocarpon pusillum Z07020]|uniref:tRNA(Ile)-lysidine synthetase n=1 Tax=Endocarpon pusillum (strain Z07020 / HMAS-L-300199) TaxID=1263415 RepID=U1G5S5_ENDPU|nr:uncharacterized protein EPUS_07470 [Endocarpon pusillum Z07020]ERF72677.1 hypothetical protein EPUS_07470 [Endocarpon pusillum Z07020]
MALAFLFQQLRGLDMAPDLDLTALIVDHGHRPDSGEEALAVSTWLKDLSIKSKILQLRWRPGQDPARLTNFETKARSLRYQQFAYASLEENIRSLFLGHHASDLAETVILRLARAQKFISAGLGGIKPVNDIPCCESVFGASCSLDEASAVSDLVSARSKRPATGQNSECRSASSSDADDNSFPGRVLVSEPGMKIYRPLLSFPKSRLIATCAQNGVPFITDPSNFDPKTTRRNTIRWLLSNNKLPKALQTESVLHLSAASMRLGQARTRKVEALMNATRLIYFDTRSSLLRLIVPRDISNAYKLSEQDAAYYVTRLLSLVSPRTETPRSFLDNIDVARWMFPELYVTNPSILDKPRDPRSMTAGDALIERLPSLSGCCWQLTRRPFRANEYPETGFSSTSTYSKGVDRYWSGWRAWDGRFWIRIQARNHPLLEQFKLRPLQRQDMEQLRAREELLPLALKQKLRRAFRDAAPGKLRYTLPLLVHGEELRGLPTLDIELPSKDSLQGDVSSQLRWEVRYKGVTETLQHLNRAASPSHDLVKPLNGDLNGQFSSPRNLEQS